VLSDPCLPEFFQTYSASAGLFALIAALFTHLIEFLAQTHALNALKQPDEYTNNDSTNTQIEEPSSHGHSHGLALSDTRNTVSVYILEAGIAVHSVIIGVDLGLTVDEFRTLLIALVFHQFFEGIGFGYRLAELKHQKKLRPLMNSLLYSCTTPLGVVIGILSHMNTVPTNYIGTVAAKGITDAMAAGILIYVALISMLYEEFNSEAFRKLSKGQKMVNFTALYVGAGLMSMIGLWA